MLFTLENYHQRISIFFIIHEVPEDTLSFSWSMIQISFLANQSIEEPLILITYIMNWVIDIFHKLKHWAPQIHAINLRSTEYTVSEMLNRSRYHKLEIEHVRDIYDA
jgi:hypothetical protein